MSAAWILSDDMLQAMLQAYLDVLASGSNFTIDLYKNNHVPAAGDTASAYTPCDFAGYLQGTIVNANWGAATVTSHVAIATQDDMNTFNASSIATTQTVYGYFVTTGAGALVYAEYFNVSVDMHANDAFDVTPELRHTTFPP